MAQTPHLKAREYAEKSKKFLNLRGVKSGEYPILERATHPQQWSDWIDYYRWKDMLALVDLMLDGQRSSKTVPSLSPYDFDPEFSPPRPRPRFYGSAE